LREEAILEKPRDATRAYIDVTIEVGGERITSTLGPLSHDEGWSVFQAFLADMKRLNPFA